MTNSDLNCDRPVMMSSTIPSAKNSCSGSPLIFWNGRTAMEGLSGIGGGLAVSSKGARAGSFTFQRARLIRSDWLLNVLDVLGTKVRKGDRQDLAYLIVR